MEILNLGPLGENEEGNLHWEETCTDPISHIFVTFNTTDITSIQFGFVKNGALVLSKKYGNTNTEGDSTRIVRLNHESEYVTGISGEWCYTRRKLWNDKYDEYPHISSLTFHTNEGKHEAFHIETDPDGGRPSMREFHSGIRDRREFAGFLGFFSDRRKILASIGLHVRPIL